MYELLENIVGNQVIAFFIAAALPLFLFILPYALLAVLAERKVSAHMQDRLGPMRVGYHGILQTLADILKLIQKEDIIPTNVDLLLFVVAPFIVFVPSFMLYMVIPISPTWVVNDLDISLFYIFGILTILPVGILIAGWSSYSKYSLLGIKLALYLPLKSAQ